MGIDADIPGNQTLYREDTIQGEPEIVKEEVRSVRLEVGQSKSEMFQVCKGVRQGCTIPLWLFNLFIDKVTREAKEHFTGGVKLSSWRSGSFSVCR